MLHCEPLPGAVVTMALTGQAALLVFTQQNILYHFAIHASSDHVALVKDGEVALGGVIRAPARVRAISWIQCESHLLQNMSTSV